MVCTLGDKRQMIAALQWLVYNLYCTAYIMLGGPSGRNQSTLHLSSEVMMALPNYPSAIDNVNRTRWCRENKKGGGWELSRVVG